MRAAHALRPVPPPAGYRDTGGEGPVVVLIHGVGLDKDMWAAQEEALRIDCRVIAVDMLGHGDSPQPPAGATLEDYAEHLRGVLDALGVASAVLIGFSMGALVARAFALAWPDRVTALVLLNGVFARSPEVRAAIVARVAEVEAHGPAANLDAALERWFSPDFRRIHADYIARLRDQFAANDPVGYARSYRLFATEDAYGLDRLGEIAAATLVATGEHDVGSTPAMAQALASHITGAAVRVIPGARHMMPVEMPAETNALLRGFLQSVAPQRRVPGDR